MILKKKEKETLNFQINSEEKKVKVNNKPLNRLRKINIPKTAQQTLPFKDIYSNGIIKVTDDLYCVICSFTNINYKSKKEDEQETIFKRYCDVLNALDPSIKFQIFLHNINIDEEQLFKELIPEKNNFQEFQKEYENLMASFISESYNKTADRKNYFAVGIKAKETKNVENFLDKAIRDAAAQFKILDSHVNRLTVEETLEFFYNFYNSNKQKEVPFVLPTDIFAKGIKIKDYIAPSSFKFKKNHAEIGTGYSRTLLLKIFLHY